MPNDKFRTPPAASRPRPTAPRRSVTAMPLLLPPRRRLSAHDEAAAEASPSSRPSSRRRRAPRRRRSGLVVVVATAASWALASSLLLRSPQFLLPVNAQYDAEAGLTEERKLRQSLEFDYPSLLDEVSSSPTIDRDPSAAARRVTERLSQSVSDRLAKLFQQTKTPQCRALVAQHLGYFVGALGREDPMPFAEAQFANECPEPHYDWDHLPEGVSLVEIQNRTYQPADGLYKAANDLRLLYGILTHDDAPATVRLVNALDDGSGNVVFVIHVDGKYDDTYQSLVDFARDRPNVHVLGHERRVRVNWGGFTMVNATLQMLQYALVDPQSPPLDFDKFIHLASSSYPLASNREIRQRLSEYPLDANLLYLIMRPARPKPWGWHYFVECDDRLHRIHRLSPLQNATHGIDLYTSSQWFIASREFAQYLAEAPSGSFVAQFLEYAQHVVVADETFFGTVLRNTNFCTTHSNRNLLHLQFDKWESELPHGKRDERKCMMLDPDHCGRSPTVMTSDYVDILELSTDLFARKFVDSVDPKVKDVVDRWRERRERDPDYRRHRHVDFEGHGVLIVAKDTVDDDDPLCLGLGETGNAVKLVPCFYEDILPTLARDWATGAVISEEVLPHNRWDLGPCTNDGHLERLPSAVMNSTRGEYSVAGPRCMMKQMDGIRAGRCFDMDSQALQPGGATQVFPCVSKWYQFVSFGDGIVAPVGSIYSTIPSHIVKQIRNLGHDHIEFMCLGLYGRGLKDEGEWAEATDEAALADQTPYYDDPPAAWERLSEFAGQNVITTQCTNEGAVIEWLFVPFIVEPTPPDEAFSEPLDDSEYYGSEEYSGESASEDEDGTTDSEDDPDASSEVDERTDEDIARGNDEL